MGTILIAVGVGILGIWLFLRQKVKAISTWTATPGRIVNSALERYQDTDKEWQERARVEYEYAVTGAVLRGDRIALGGGGKLSARAAVHLYQPGGTVEVYYDPQKPSSAVLERDLSANLIALPILAGAFVVGGVVVMAVS